MFTHKHYVPVLKAKAGEYWALEHLNAPAAAGLTPLIELVNPRAPRKKADGTIPPAKTIKAHLLEAADDLDKAWAGGRPFFVDPLHLKTPATSTIAALNDFFDSLKSKNAKPIPVTGTNRAPHYQAFVQNRAAADRNGVMLRIHLPDFADQSQLPAALTGLMRLLKQTPATTDLMIDYGARPEKSLVAQLTRLHIPMLPTLSAWRTLTVSSGSFPPSLMAFATTGLWHRLSRVDWESWYAAVTGKPPLSRKPAYSDYGIRDPSPPSDWGQASANLRYTADNEFLVRQGKKMKAGGAKEMQAMCTSLCKQSEYSGKSFSAGDTEIQARQASGSLPGGPQQWLQWCTNHHLEKVVNQIATSAGL